MSASKAQFHFPHIIIVAFSENATIGYSLESLCVSVSVCPCLFLHDNSKRKQSMNTKFEYIVVYENSSDEFDIEFPRIKVKVTDCRRSKIFPIYHNTNCQVLQFNFGTS